jgi:hypothetical protein
MAARRILAVLLPVLLAAALLWSAPSGRRWAKYEAEMQDPVDDPEDAWEETEFAFARLRFRSFRDGRRWGGYARWGIDCNKSDRQFMGAIRRLSRIQVRSVEHIVDIDSDEIFDWPWLYAVSVGDWVVSDEQAARLRKYFERGGFLVVDDFHGEREWENFMAGLAKVFPGRPAVELPDEAPIFQTLYDVRERFQVPGLQVIHGQMAERGGIIPHWRAILDDKNRVQVAMWYNHDFGDAWEWADHPEYPEKFASMAFRMGLNYVLYAMTH